MKSGHPQGFTLIELLTVIAIIAILAGLTFTVAGPMREKGKLTKLESTFHNIEIAMTAYLTDNDGTYPPGYGFLSADTFGLPADQVLAMGVGQRFFLKPYTSCIGKHNTSDVTDLFSTAYDGNRDNMLDPTEFLPIGIRVADGPPTFHLDQRYGSGPEDSPLDDEVSQQLNAKSRPLYYAPVNKEQYTRAKKYWLSVYATEKSNGQIEATSWDPNAEALRGMRFPPTRYDAFALISVGPVEHYQGVVAAGEEYGNYFQWLFSNFPNEAYHILALRSYYLAKRDLNDNNALDFDFRARKSGEASVEPYTVNLKGGQQFIADNNLPNLPMPAGYGPVLFTNK